MPSVTDLAPIVLKTGAWLPDSVTVMVTTSLSVRAPSEARKVTLKLPAWVKSGVQSNVAVPLPLSVKVAPVGSTELLKLGVVPSGSAAETEKLRLAPSLTNFAPMAASTGVWLPASSIVI